jgi:hypothetical protein
MNDKNSLSWTENLGKMALYVKGKASTTYPVLCLGYGGSACACPPSLSPARLCLAVAGGRKGCQGKGGISLGEGKGDPDKMGSENQSSLSG